MQGTVKWFDRNKGYGFIQRDGADDVFVHYTGIEGSEAYKSLDEDDEVTFDVEKSDKGLSAVNVKLA